MTKPKPLAATANEQSLYERICALLLTARQNSSAKGALKVRVGAEFPLTKAADSHRALEGRVTTGKVLLLP